MIEFGVISILVVTFGLVCFVGSPYLPTRKEWAKDSLEFAELDKNDFVVDLGSGDGKILRLLAKKGIRSVGYEINPFLVLLTKLSLINNKLAKVELGNYWKINLPKETTVVYVFTIERDAFKLEKYLQKQVKLVNAKKLKVIVFGLNLPNKKPIKTTDSSQIYLFE